MFTFSRALCALGVACAVGTAHADNLSPAEERIVASVRANAPQAMDLLERTVNINSGTMNHAGVREVGKIFAQELDKLGFKTRWIEMPASMQRAGHLEATRTGKQGKRLLLLGHLDTVFEPDDPVQKFERRGDRIRGQGISDMKGGDVVVIEALRALHKEGALDNTTITVMFTGDEEDAGDPKSISRRDMVDAAKRSDIALAFEGTVVVDGNATGTVGRRSSSSWTLEVKGRQGHSSGIFGQGTGYGAIYEAARILDAFRRELPEANLTYNPGVILGGTTTSFSESNMTGTAYGKENIIANTTLVKGDLRFLTMEQAVRVRAQMREIVAQSLPGTSASITFQDSYPPMAPTPGNMKLLDIYSKASADAGLGTVAAYPPGKRGAGDIQFVSSYVDSLDGLGVSGRGAHSPNEDLEPASLEKAAVRTALLIYRLTR
ncbi:M20/M25/M40 family metallo-hydrolase [Pseudoduganella sp. GCM10020061]|uniref:M20/M25/M40 family metallo-hydrolase n=1 Tax=Pseudoduganella sp. GCM10020061 TaxID=3317345 RepID=UPI00362AEAC9